MGKNTNGEQKVIWAIGGGKGGSGKSFLTANIGICLSRSGLQVVLVDADLGGANLHTFLGISPSSLSMTDFIKKRVFNLKEALIPTAIPSLRLLAGAQDLLNASETKTFQRQKLLRAIRKLDADYVLLDLGAGNAVSVLDFFLMSDGGIFVVTPEPTSIENAYRFLKSAFNRRIRQSVSSPEIKALIDRAADQKNELGIRTPYDLIEAVRRISPGEAQRIVREVECFHPNLVLNQVHSKKDIEIGFSIKSACRKYFGIELNYLGYIVYDPEVTQSIRKRKPLVLENPESKAAQGISVIASKLVNSRESLPGKIETFQDNMPPPVTE